MHVNLSDVDAKFDAAGTQPQDCRLFPACHSWHEKTEACKDEKWDAAAPLALFR